MAETVRLVETDQLNRNPENPRLIFRQEELDALQDSIAKNGILVPLTIFQDARHFYILDGERRWRCALKLGLLKVPVIIQPKPDRMQNLMMMFAIHNARKDWDPLPTALKLEDLEKEFTKRNGKKPTESEIAGMASLSRGEVRRLKVLLNLPASYRNELMAELDKPRSKQEITVDHVLEATRAADALRKRSVLSEDEEEQLRRAIIGKFRSKVIDSTVAPRKLVKMAQAVERGEITRGAARNAVQKLISEPNYDIGAAFRETVEQADFDHAMEQLATRLLSKLDEHVERGYHLSGSLKETLELVVERIRSLL